MNLNFTVDIHDPVIVYSLKGKIVSDLDFEDLEKEVFSYLNQNYFRVVFNLEELTHTNSAGIAFFMRTLTKSRIMGGDLVLTNLKGNTQKVFEIAKLDEVYVVKENLEDGINYFNS